MSSRIVDLFPSSKYWTNSGTPVILVENEAPSGLNAIKANNNGVNLFEVPLNNLFNTLPKVSELTGL